MAIQTQQRSTEAARIHGQLQSTYSGDAWHGDPLIKILDGITAAQASAKPIPGAHSIWELVQHIAVWEDVVRRRLAGEDVQPTPEQDWPPVSANSEAAWKATVDKLRSAHSALERAVTQISDDKLEEIAPGTKHTVYFMLHGLIQHDLYHAGQVAILKKGVRQ